MDLSEIETLQLTLKGMGTLADMQAFLMERKMTELESIAVEANVEGRLASTKIGVIDQIIAKLVSNVEAATESELEAVIDPGADAPDEASAGQGVLPVEEAGGGVSIPAKVAAMPPERLWSEILGWEIDQRLGEDTPVYSTDELREYLAYLWNQGALGRDPKLWSPISDYEFRGLA